MPAHCNLHKLPDKKIEAMLYDYAKRMRCLKREQLKRYKNISDKVTSRVKMIL